MIKLNEHRVAIVNLPVTIAAMEDLETLMKYYSEDKPGPAYTKFTHVDGPGEVYVQFDRKIILGALEQQHRKFVESLKSLGIEA